MTAVQNFCYLALLQASARLSGQLKAAPNETRSAVEQALIELHGTTKDELRRRWSKGREQEVARHLDDISGRLRMNLKAFPPQLKRWFLANPGN